MDVESAIRLLGFGFLSNIWYIQVLCVVSRTLQDSKGVYGG